MDVFGYFMALFLAAAVYFLPSIVAVKRNKINAGAIFVVNFFLGWTLLGWALPLAWALLHEGKRTVHWAEEPG
jgi:Superinfection immunity protein